MNQKPSRLTVWPVSEWMTFATRARIGTPPLNSWFDPSGSFAIGSENNGKRQLSCAIRK